MQLFTAKHRVSDVGCDTALNSALAFIEGFAPRNEVEAAVALQMACTQSAAMFSLVLNFQLRFIRCNKRTNFGCHIQQLEPLLFVEGHREAPHPVD